MKQDVFIRMIIGLLMIYWKAIRNKDEGVQFLWELRQELKMAIERLFYHEKDSSIETNINSLLTVEISEEDAKDLFEG